MAEAAIAAVAGAASASVSLCQDGAILVTAASAEAARRLDEAQFSAGRGPGVEAVLDGREVALGDLPPDRWPEFAAAAAAQDICSALAVPMATAAHRGIVSVYGSSARLFADPAVRDTARDVVRCVAAVLSASDRYSQASAVCPAAPGPGVPRGHRAGEGHDHGAGPVHRRPRVRRPGPGFQTPPRQAA